MLSLAPHRLCAIAIAGAITGPLSLHAQTLTTVTTDMLRELKFDAAILKGIEDELKIPQAWLDGARKEGKVAVRMTMHPSRFEKVRKIFEARYPDIKVEYSRGIGQARALGPILAYKRGNFVTDIVSSFEPLHDQYIKANALVSLKDLVTFKNPRDEFNAKDGTAVAYRLQHYCTAYNPKKIKKEDLPKTWDDILTDRRLHGGKIGVAINVNAWLAPLWGTKGEKWALDYMDKLFNVVKPQIRKERLSMTPKLTALGEFDLTIPGGDFIVRGHADEGVPVAYHCPIPVPVTSAWIGILRGNPHPNASKVFVNWVLSKEGQLANNWADNFIPAHKGMQSKEFLPYPDDVLGKPIAPLSPFVLDQMPKIIKVWHSYWVKSGGELPGARKKPAPR